MDETALARWLRLREQPDWTARSTALTQMIAETWPRDRPMSVLDLATGTGSNLRYLLEHLPGQQRWLLIDRSTKLLSDVEERTRAWTADRGNTVHAATRASAGFSVVGPRLDCQVEILAHDLGTLHDPSIFAGRHLVTASAFLDLVSEPWLRTLAAHCRAVRATALFALTYDGRSSCVPAEPEDELVRGLMNQHQRRDKGVGGVAEGPGAAACAIRCFEEVGYRVTSEESDWTLDPGAVLMQRTLIDGWAEAASEVAPHGADRIAAWRMRRLAHVDAGVSHVVVGHRDVAAWPE